MQWILLVTTWHLFPSAAFLIYRKPRCETEWSRRLLSFLVPKKATGRHTLLFFWLLACLRMKLTLREAKKREADWVPGDMPKPLNHYKANSPLGLANIQDQKKSFLFKPFWVGFLLPCKICSWSLAFLLFIRWRFLNNKMMGTFGVGGRVPLDFSYDGENFQQWPWHPTSRPDTSSPLCQERKVSPLVHSMSFSLRLQGKHWSWRPKEQGALERTNVHPTHLSWFLMIHLDLQPWDSK